MSLRVTWRAYAAGVFVSAGALIQGVLWLQRPGGGIRAEDLAELQAAISERQALAFSCGTNDAVWPSNSISPVRVWADLYDVVMKPALGSATNGLMRGDDERIYIAWADAGQAAAENGDWLTRPSRGWVVHEVTSNRHPHGVCVDYTWRLGEPTNVQEYACLAATVVPGGGVNYWPDTRTNRLPYAELVYGTNMPAELGVEWGAGNWWTNIGMGTNVYAYGCEYLVMSGGVASVTLIGGDGFEASPTSLAFTVANYAAAQRVFVTGGGVPKNRAAVFKIAGDTGWDVFGVADAPGYVLPAGWNPGYMPILSAVPGGPACAAYEVPGGATNLTLSIRAEFASSNPNRVSLYYSGDVSGPSEVAWWVSEGSGEFTVACKEGGGGTIRVISPAGPFYQYSVAVVNPADSGDAVFNVEPHVQHVEGAAAAVDVRMRPRRGDQAVLASKWVTTQNLNQAYCVLSNMTRTVAFVPTYRLTYTNCVYNYTGFSTNWNFSREPSQPGWSLYDRFADLVWEPLDGVSEEAWDGSSLLLYKAFAHRLDEASSEYDSYPPYDLLYWEWDTYAGYESTVKAWHLRGCALPYPSVAAWESGRVARVRVYAVAYLVSQFASDTYSTGDFFIPYDDYYTVDEFAFDGVSSEPGEWTDTMLGCIGAVNTLPHSETNACDESRVDQYLVYSEMGAAEYPKSGLRLALVGEITEMGQTFDLGVTWPVEDAGAVFSKRHLVMDLSEDGRGPMWKYERWWIGFGREFRIACFVVVVDWNWEHCNPDRPYVPETWVPGWMVRP